MNRTLFLIGFLIFSYSCGKKAPPVPPPPPSKPVAVSKPSILKGYGGYKIGDEGFVALYWDFPVKVDHSEVYLNGEKIATVKGYTYLYPKPLERGKTYTFEVVGFKNGKPKAKVEIKVNY